MAANIASPSSEAISTQAKTSSVRPCLLAETMRHAQPFAGAKETNEEFSDDGSDDGQSGGDSQAGEDTRQGRREL